MHAAGCSTALRQPSGAPAALRGSAARGGARCRAAATSRAAPLRVRAEESMSEAYARIRESRRRSKEKYEREQKLESAGPVAKFFSGFVSALDFQEDIKADRGALNAAKRLRSGERMSNESAGALKRKVGGTKAGFFGESVDVKGKYVDQGYLSSKPVEVPYIPVLVVIVLGIVAATVVVVARTG